MAITSAHELPMPLPYPLASLPFTPHIVYYWEFTHRSHCLPPTFVGPAAAHIHTCSPCRLRFTHGYTRFRCTTRTRHTRRVPAFGLPTVTAPALPTRVPVTTATLPAHTPLPAGRLRAAFTIHMPHLPAHHTFCPFLTPVYFFPLPISAFHDIPRLLYTPAGSFWFWFGWFARAFPRVDLTHPHSGLRTHHRGSLDTLTPVCHYAI